MSLSTRNGLITKRQAVIDRLNRETNNSMLAHEFDAESGECGKCHRLLVDEVTTDATGVQHINMFCPVIGPREVARFRNYEG